VRFSILTSISIKCKKIFHYAMTKMREKDTNLIICMLRFLLKIFQYNFLTYLVVFFVNETWGLYKFFYLLLFDGHKLPVHISIREQILICMFSTEQ